MVYSNDRPESVRHRVAGVDRLEVRALHATRFMARRITWMDEADVEVGVEPEPEAHRRRVGIVAPAAVEVRADTAPRRCP